MADSKFPSAPSGQYPAEPPPPYAQNYPSKPPAAPPASAYYPQQPAGAAPTTTAIYVMGPTMFGPDPMNTQCPNCHTQIVTQTMPVTGTLTWLICAGCVLFGLILGCCLIPFCVDDFQDIEHRCPQCKHYLGSYRRM